MSTNIPDSKTDETDVEQKPKSIREKIGRVTGPIGVIVFIIVVLIQLKNSIQAGGIIGTILGIVIIIIITIIGGGIITALANLIITHNRLNKTEIDPKWESVITKKD